MNVVSFYLFDTIFVVVVAVVCHYDLLERAEKLIND